MLINIFTNALNKTSKLNVNHDRSDTLTSVNCKISLRLIFACFAHLAKMGTFQELIIFLDEGTLKECKH